MIVNVSSSVQESCNIYCIRMELIPKLVRDIILYPNTYSNSKQIIFTTKNQKRKLSPHSSSALTNRSGNAHLEINSVVQPKARTMVSSLLTPLISFLYTKSQTIEVILMHHLYATIIHLKVDHIVHGVSSVEINLIIPTIQDHQLLPSLKIKFF